MKNMIKIKEQPKFKPKALIDSNEFIAEVLDCIGDSNYIDELLRDTIFDDKPDCRAAFIYGMTVASMMTSQCKPVCVMVEE